MKRFLSVLLVAVMTLILFTGCVRIRATIKVNSTGTVDVSMLYAFSRSLSEMAGQDSMIDEESIEELKAQGYTYEPYSDDEYEGYIISKNGMSDFKEGLFDNPATLTKEGSKYIIDIPWNADDEDSSASELAAAGAMVSAQGGFAEIIMILPVKPESHNATRVSEDGKTLTWNLLRMGSNSSIHVEYNIQSIIVFWLIRAAIALAVIAVIVILVIVIVRLLKNRKKKSSVSATTNDLREYKKMLDDGLLTQEEYDIKKSELLNIARTDTKPETTAESGDGQGTEQ